MYKTTVHCDVCDKKLEIVKKITPFGEVEVIKNSQTKVIDTRLIFPHLCENCALKIDNELLKTKLEMVGDGE